MNTSVIPSCAAFLMEIFGAMIDSGSNWYTCPSKLHAPPVSRRRWVSVHIAASLAAMRRRTLSVFGVVIGWTIRGSPLAVRL